MRLCHVQVQGPEAANHTTAEAGDTESECEAGHGDTGETMTNVDHFFLTSLGTIVFFMQCGFGFLEAGAVRSKNTVNILIKNWLDMCFGALAYWATGFGLTWGEDAAGLAGTSLFLGIQVLNIGVNEISRNTVIVGEAHSVFL